MKHRAGYYLLFRREGEHKVWVYEKLQKHEIKARLRKGWRVWNE
ncbi:hypothetical protein [Oceanobacillus arenosus]|nr:hypothetical protein [Oceanobacillus arenosus]